MWHMHFIIYMYFVSTLLIWMKYTIFSNIHINFSFDSKLFHLLLSIQLFQMHVGTLIHVYFVCKVTLKLELKTFKNSYRQNQCDSVQ